MSRRARYVLLLVIALQGVAFAIYRAVERSRARAARPFVAERLGGEERAPDLELEAADGRKLRLLGRDRPLLVHFWATWCVPCRTELPGLLAFAAREQARVDVVAVSVDEGWNDIRRFFDGPVPTPVARARDPRAHERFGSRALPDSYLVDGDGRLLARFAGARDWTSPEAAAHIRTALANAGQ